MLTFGDGGDPPLGSRNVPEFVLLKGESADGMGMAMRTVRTMNLLSVLLTLSAGVAWLLVEYSGAREARLKHSSTKSNPVQGPGQVS